LASKRLSKFQLRQAVNDNEVAPALAVGVPSASAQELVTVIVNVPPRQIADGVTEILNDACAHWANSINARMKHLASLSFTGSEKLKMHINFVLLGYNFG